jgi:acid phosphatase type 7
MLPGVGDPSSGGWVSTRPLLYVPGNHDVRGEHARVRPSILAAGPNPDLPYNMALRIGPLAIVTLDSGEDKPDRHPVFAGTAAYEPYRELQGAWLAAQLRRPDIADAPFRIAFSHIPLRGLPGENDGSILEGHARYTTCVPRLSPPPMTRPTVESTKTTETSSTTCCPSREVTGARDDRLVAESSLAVVSLA